MNDLKSYSDGDLKKELERREKERNNVPSPKLNPDFSDVVDAAKSYIVEVQAGVVDDDTEHYIFEAVMEAVYGEKVWDWINKLD